jgi:hypothetical protein
MLGGFFYQFSLVNYDKCDNKSYEIIMIYGQMDNVLLYKLYEWKVMEN